MNTSARDFHIKVKPSQADKQIILIVDDNAMNRAILADMIGSDYEIVEAENGLECVALMRKLGSSISLVLLDINMPEMDGFAVLDVMNKNHWINDIPVVMVTAETAPSYIEKAYDLGVMDFINRPFDANVVRRRVNNTIMLFAKQKTLVGMVADQIREREKANSLMISILSHIVEFRNGESGLHVMHVSAVTELLLNQISKKSDKYKLTQEDISRISMASSLHDIGKISIPDEVLNKPGRLTDEEFELMKTHTSIGAGMLEDVPVSQDDPLVHTAYEICRWHHERYDGRGYPDGLKGDEIPISAQAVALADVYDALTSVRVYKDAYSHEKAIEMILNGECGSFNPFLLECFVEIADDIREQFSVSSLDDASDMGVVHIDEETISPGEGKASSHTLELLDYERMKYRFFASMSNELQYEYTESPSVAVFSDWGEQKMGIPEIVKDPYEDRTLNEIFGKENLLALSKELRATSADDPVVQMEREINIRGEKRWCRLIAHANWSSDDPSEYLGSIGKIIDIHEDHQKIADLQLKATHDSLTGLLNHVNAKKLVCDNIEAEPDKTFVFVMLDIDKFKEIKDAKGRLYADRLLRNFSQRLERSVRGNDIVSRVGGDEFFVCMQCTVDPIPLVKRIYDTVIGEYDELDISVSMGVSMGQGDGLSYEEMFKSADRALAKIKSEGGGGYLFASDISGDNDGVTSVSDIDEVSEENIEAAKASR